MATTEERLAALEAKLAALTATTPTEYYTHQYFGEEIDAAVGRALTGGALDTSVTNVSNQLGTFVRPNLLDNWYFGRPVNQRGQTEYAGNWVYSVDRWELADNNGTLQIFDTGIMYATANYLFQALTDELSNDLRGKRVTVSVLYEDSLFFESVIIKQNWTTWDVMIKTEDFGLIGTNNNTRLWCQIGRPNKRILAAKLELGPTQTLAHQENGVWILNEVPEYGEQLRRCQRYYIKYDTIKANGYISNAAKSYYMPIFLPEAMRIKPTILGTPKIRVRFNGGYSARFIGGTFTAPDSWSVVGISSNSCILSFNVSTAVDPNNIPVSIEVEGLELSADL